MKYKDLNEETIKSLCKKWRFKIKGNFIFHNDLAIYENSFLKTDIFNIETLCFLEGFNCAKENEGIAQEKD